MVSWARGNLITYLVSGSLHERMGEGKMESLDILGLLITRRMIIGVAKWFCASKSYMECYGKGGHFRMEVRWENINYCAGTENLWHGGRKRWKG